MRDATLSLVSVCFTHSRSSRARSTNVTVLSGGTLGRKKAGSFQTHRL